MYPRTITKQMQDGLGKPGTALILYGPRQSGKTTLVKQLLEALPDALSFTGDDLYTQSLLARHELEHLFMGERSGFQLFVGEGNAHQRVLDLILAVFRNGCLDIPEG